MDNDNFDHIVFRDQIFLNQTQLTQDNILDYFSTSQFYDKSCINEVFKMQTRYLGYTEMEESIQEKLSKVIGLQYVLENDLYSNNQGSQNAELKDLFIIYKIERYSRNEFDVLNIYYVLHGNIYQAPSINSIMENRKLNAYYWLNNGIDLFIDKQDFNFFKGFLFKNDSDSNEETKIDSEKRLLFCRALEDFARENLKEEN